MSCSSYQARPAGRGVAAPPRSRQQHAGGRARAGKVGARRPLDAPAPSPPHAAGGRDGGAGPEQAPDGSTSGGAAASGAVSPGPGARGPQDSLVFSGGPQMPEPASVLSALMRDVGGGGRGVGW